MEERIIDNEREIKIKRKRGVIDAQDALAEDTEVQDEEEEVVLEFPDGEYDEDLVGLTPAQLKEELARRERAKREALDAQTKLMAEGEEKLQEKAYADAEIFFAQALVYGENAQASERLWRARTHDFSDTESFYEKTNAEEFALLPEDVRGCVLDRMKERLQTERVEYEAEATPLKEEVESAIAARRGPFLANKAYYLFRFRICLFAFVLCIVGAVISASMIYSTEGMLPVWIAIGFGAAALVCLGLTIAFLRKLFEARRLCVQNDTLSSTEEGARLEYLNERLECLNLVLGE